MSERQHARPAGAEDGRPMRRQIVKFTFFKVDPAWRRLPPDERAAAKDDLCAAVEAFGDRLLIKSYSTVGTRGDADFLLWQIGDRLDDVQQFTSALLSTAMGPYLSIPYSYLAMTRKSVYVSPEEEARETRLIIRPTDSRYLFVYPFVKTRPWYLLPLEKRQELMNEHIRIGRKYPSVKLNTTYSFGLDDQEFVVAFETDEPADFLDLVMELRETESSLYTLRDTPIFSCIAMPLREALDAVGAPGEAVPAVPAPADAPAGWTRVAALEDLSEAAGTVVYVRGQQVALFRQGGRVYAIGNRCSHANASLADGTVEDGAVTCPFHNSRFDLATGQPTGGPAQRPVPAYRVKVEDGQVYLATGRAEPAAAGAAGHGAGD
ncbi:MAG TPA: chlorite dismutase family protein [Dehalococcoidia bacterium]